MTETSPQPMPDDPPQSLGERLQARVEQFEARPELTTDAPNRSRNGSDRVVSISSGIPGTITDLATDLDNLRAQLDVAFDHVENRIAAAQAKADAAESRAQVVGSETARLRAAIEELATDLEHIAGSAHPEDQHRLQHAVERLRARLQTT